MQGDDRAWCQRYRERSDENAAKIDALDEQLQALIDDETAKLVMRPYETREERVSPD